jgi:large repetitive protein
MKTRFKICIEGEIEGMATINASYTVTVAPAVPPPNPLTITPNGGNLPSEQVGVADSGDVVGVVTGGTPPYTFEVTGGQLPPGMSLSSSENPDGSEIVTIDGTPTQSGAFNFSLSVTDSAGATATATVKKPI